MSKKSRRYDDWRGRRKLLGWVGRRRADGEADYLIEVEDTWYWKRTWDIALKQASYEKTKSKDGKIDVILIPEAQCVLKRDKGVWGTKAACQYHSIDDYFQNVFGRKLAFADKDWFQDHPSIQSGGVPMSHTLTVAQQLIEPYGFKVSRAVVRPGVAIAQDELKKWLDILGINPLGMTDLETSNAQFCEKTGLPYEDALKQFRLEYSREHLRPCVTCDGKLGAGHASYKSFRAKPTWDFVLQFQIDFAEKVNWRQEVKIPDYGDMPENMTLDFEECLCDDGKTLDDARIDSLGYWRSKRQSKREDDWRGNYSDDMAWVNGKWVRKEKKQDALPGLLPGASISDDSGKVILTDGDE
jgi:hypothetical protein